MEFNRSYYAVIPANIRYDSDISANAKLLYGEITSLCNDKGYCWASNEYFAELYGVGRTSIQNWIKSLVDKGYIFREVTYKKGTKEIDKRLLKLHPTPHPKNWATPTQKIGSPHPKNWADNNNIINNNTYTDVYVATTENKLKNLGLYSNLSEAIDEMKKDQSWKDIYGKQSGIKNPNDCDAWIDRYRDHALASGKTSSSIRELKNHCLNWTRKRIASGDVIQRKMTEQEKHELRQKRFSS